LPEGGCAAAGTALRYGESVGESSRKYKKQDLTLKRKKIRISNMKYKTIKENTEARSPKYETNYNDGNGNIQNRLTKQSGILVI